MQQDGKTLMELMMVVAILGMVSGMAVPNFLALYSRAQVRSVTENIASELRLARQLAITARDRVRVQFDLDQRAMAATLEAGAQAPRIYRYRDSGVVVEEPSAGAEIVFYPSGRSATASTIRLRSREGQAHTLTVSMTGRVSIQ